MAKNIKKKIKEKKVGLFKRIGFKIALTVGCASLLASVICMLITIPSSISTVKKITNEEIMSLISAYSTQVESKLQDNPVLTYTNYQGLVGNLKITGVKSSYSYVVSKDGKMIYHPKEDKIGKPVENDMIKDVVAQIQKGTKPENKVVEYDYKGDAKTAGYKVLSNSDVLVVTADTSEILSSVSQMTLLGVGGALAVTILCTIAGVLIVIFIVKPIAHLTEVIDDTANLDFSKDQAVTQIAKRKDEVGMMGKSVLKMRTQLREMVKSILDISEKITKDVDKLKDVSIEIREDCTDNSATTEELAAGMEETSATTGTITNNIDQMQSGAKDISNLSQNGVQLSDEIRERADSLRESTDVAMKKTTQMYETIREKAESAMKAAECVKEINAMTESIMQISSQTSLLSLNASIEAARAGEAGKGFAVVASEISKLAGETSDSVTSINHVVEQVNATVEEMLQSMTDTTDFLEEVVVKDYTQFGNVSKQYSDDAEAFKSSMTNVEASIEQLAQSIEEIADAINGINATVDEASIGVSDIAEKTSSVVNKTKDNVSIVETCTESVTTLDSMGQLFHL